MMWPDQWSATDWLLPVLALLILAVATAIYSYGTQWNSWILGIPLTLKVIAIGLLGLCLLEPQTRQERAEPGANTMILMADRSQSLQLKDPGSDRSRADQMLARLTEDQGWLQQLETDFQLRKYLTDRQLEPVSNFDSYQAVGQGSPLLTNLRQTLNRPSGKPLAGVLLLTDGNASDVPLLERWKTDGAPDVPVYPVVIGSRSAPSDLAIQEVVASQSNFEAAPVSFQVRAVASGFAGKTAVVQLKNQAGATLDRKDVEALEDGKPFQVQLRTTVKEPGVSIYQVEVVESSMVDQPWEALEASGSEATLANNRRSVVVDRGRSPLRLLYVTGRPNWELKYLRRAVFDDEELELVALVRIAKREAKFTFRGRDGQDSNALFRGFENQDDDTAERFDEPVFIRLGTRDSEELRGGFPKTTAELFQYDAILLDDVEADFFTQDQQTMLQEFASTRGGGVMMLGGQESFAAGEYDKTAIGEMLPVYLDGQIPEPSPDHKLSLTREGWLQPWVRIHTTEKEEQKRLGEMPSFFTLNPVRSIKPGATVLAQVTDNADRTYPALVIQPFGRGRTAAWLVGDMWRWQLRSEADNNDLLAFWRQVMRWLVSDVPGRCDVSIDRDPDNPAVTQIVVKVNDVEFRPLDNADVQVSVTDPEGNQLPITVRPSESTSGEYLTSYYAEGAGVYQVQTVVKPADGGEALSHQSAWVNEPAVEEFARLVPNFEAMEELARISGGEMVAWDDLDQLVSDLPNKKVPITRTVTSLWWHRWPIFMLGIVLLVTEWGFRRWRGLP